MPESNYSQFIGAHPLALLINRSNFEFCPCPLIYDQDRHRLLGHLANSNPALTRADGTQISAVFSGVNGYISASWYPESNQVPTWNYQILEVRGKLALLSSDESLSVLSQQTDFFENQVGENWRLEKLSAIQRQELIKAIQIFEIPITDWQGKAKLSQNKSQPQKESLYYKLSETPYPGAEALLKEMKNA